MDWYTEQQILFPAATALPWLLIGGISHQILAVRTVTCDFALTSCSEY